jgi:hypothetical protein
LITKQETSSNSVFVKDFYRKDEKLINNFTKNSSNLNEQKLQKSIDIYDGNLMATGTKFNGIFGHSTSSA